MLGTDICVFFFPKAHKLALAHSSEMSRTLWGLLQPLLKLLGLQAREAMEIRRSRAPA